MTYEYTQPLDSTSSVKRITNDRLWNVRLTSARCPRGPYFLGDSVPSGPIARPGPRL